MRHCLALLALVCSSFAQGQSVLRAPLEPQGPWKVDYAPEECRLVRAFGPEGQATLLRIARGGNVGSFDVVLAGSEIPKLPQRVSVDLTLTPQGINASMKGYSLGVPGRPERFVRWFDTNLEVLDQAAADQVFKIRIDGRHAVDLHVTSFKPALAALETCYADLLRGWGLDDRSASRILATRSITAKLVNDVTARRFDLPNQKGDPGNWVTSADYPSEALRNELSGTVTVVLALDEEGRPDKCNIAVSSNVPALDSQTCTVLLRRAKYSPARDETGIAVRAATVMRVRWMIPSQ